MTYTIGDTPSTFTWSNADVTSAQGTPSSCGSISWSIENLSGSSIFTIDTVSTNTISVSSAAIADAGSYNFKATAYYVNYLAVKDEKQFSIEVVDPCKTATIDLNSDVVPNSKPSYTIGAGADVQQFDFSKASVSVTTVACPSLVFQLTKKDGSSLDASLFTFDGANEQLVTSSDDLSKARSYDLRLTATMDGNPIPGSFDITFTVAKPPCVTDSLTIDEAPFANPSGYLLIYDVSSTAQTFRWSDAYVTSQNGLTDCGALSWSLQSVNGKKIDD